MGRRHATWYSAAFAILDGERIAVAYKHHLDRILTNPGELTVFYNYQARAAHSDDEASASEWGMDFKLAVERSGKLIIAEPEWDGGKLVSVGFMDCYGPKLSIEVLPAPIETIRIGPSTRTSQPWEPDGYANAEHRSNHETLRR